MTAQAIAKIGPDYPASIAACVALSILGYVDFLGMPILVGTLVDQAGYTVEQVGYLASADLGGLFVASVVASFAVAHYNRRHTVALGLVLAIVANLMSCLPHAISTLMVVRFLAGAGGGAVYAVVVAIVAGSTQTARNFTYLIFCIAVVNALMLYSFPYIALQWGPNGLFLTLAGIVACGLGLVHLLPPFFDADAVANDAQSAAQPIVLPAVLAWIGLSAVFGFYFMVGAYWSYLERIGVHLGFTTAFVGEFLAYCTILSLTGCGVAYWLSQRAGLSRPLIWSLGIVAVTMALFGTNVSPVMYFISTGVVFLFWNFIDIYQLGTLAKLDHTGRYCALTPAAQGLAMTIAPSAAGLLLGKGFGYAIIMYLGAASTLFAFLAYCYVHARLRALDPAAADSA